MLADYTLFCKAVTNQGVPETVPKNCDVYTSMLILLVTPDKKRTCMKAARRVQQTSLLHQPHILS